MPDPTDSGPVDEVVDPVVDPVVRWYRRERRELPWRAPERTAWGVLVSEVMLAQTPVARVVPVWRVWLARWPAPAALAAEPTCEAIRAWGRLGYPRRALRLHEAAQRCVREHDGRVPGTYDELRALAGVGDYTAAAVLAFAYGSRAVVLDTNVRRVLARLLGGHAGVGLSVTHAERTRADGVLPRDGARAAQWSAAVMELGALICTARAPACGRCPVVDSCAWRAAGLPAYDGPARRPQRYEGSDRQVRGLLLGTLRDSAEPIPVEVFATVWPHDDQRERALSGLVEDGLVEPFPDGRYALPS